MSEQNIDITILKKLNKTLKKNLYDDLQKVNGLLGRIIKARKRIAR